MSGQVASTGVNEEGELTSLLKRLTLEQLDFVRERLGVATDAEAARRIGVAPETVSRWKNRDSAPIDAVIQYAKMDSIAVAREHLRRLALRAVEVLEEEMRGRRKLDAAKEVLNRVGLETGSRVDVTSGGDKLDLGGMRDILARRLDTLIDAE